MVMLGDPGEKLHRLQERLKDLLNEQNEIDGELGLLIGREEALVAEETAIATMQSHLRERRADYSRDKERLEDDQHELKDGLEGLLTDIAECQEEFEAQREFEDDNLGDLKEEAQALRSDLNGANGANSKKKTQRKK